MRLFVLLFLGLTIFVKGQNTSITLKVVDATTKRPIKNANVFVPGTRKGTFTNVLGFCKLEVSADEKYLIISHVSYQTGTIKIPSNAMSFSVPLQKAARKLPDIDLTRYPNKFNPNDFTRLPERSDHLSDSAIVVESFADFPYEGGIQFTFSDFFGNAFRFPMEELKAGKVGMIDLEFTIDRTGGYTDAKCLSDSLSQMCQELKRVLTVIPKWTPARQHGEPVPQTFLLHVIYGSNKYWRKQGAN